MKTFAYKHESLTAEYHLHAKQMTNRRVQCLVEANKRGLTLYYDPPTVQNRCFYRCLAKFLDIAEDDVVEMVESFMISNQVISCKNKDGEIEEKDLFQYLSNADFPRLGKRPSSWLQAVEALRNEMTTHTVILSAAALFALEMHIIDWEGRTEVVSNPSGQTVTKIYLAYTGDHYMLLQPKDDANQTSKATNTEKHRNAPQFHHDGPEEYNPGVSIFKGNLIKLEKSSMSNKPASVKVELVDDVKGVADCGALGDLPSDMELDYGSTNDIKVNVGSFDTARKVRNFKN